MRVLVTGAAGAGTSTLGRRLATRLGATFQEADDLYWHDTTPPFRHKRAPGARLAGMTKVIDGNTCLVVSGSVMSWGQAVEDAFDAIIFLTAPTRTRLERIRRRDTRRYGVVDPAFLEWAAQYDDGAMAGRSLARHDAWLAARRCPVLRLESTEDPATLAQRACDLLGVR